MLKENHFLDFGLVKKHNQTFYHFGLKLKMNI